MIAMFVGLCGTFSFLSFLLMCCSSAKELVVIL